MDAAVLDALEIGCYDLGCFDTHSVLDAAVLDATVLDGTILDVVNTPYEGDFGGFLEVMNVGCYGFGCCVNWMLRSWMLQYSPAPNTSCDVTRQVANSLVIGTFLSAPLMFVSAWMVSLYSTVQPSQYIQYIDQYIFDISTIGLVCCVSCGEGRGGGGYVVERVQRLRAVIITFPFIHCFFFLPFISYFICSCIPFRFLLLCILHEI